MGKRYQIEEFANRNMAGRIDTAVIYDTEVPKEKINAFESTFGTSEFHGWQDNPAVVAIFDIDDDSETNEEAEYIAWLEAHVGEYEIKEPA